MTRTAGDALGAAIRAHAETILRGHDDVRTAAARAPGAPDDAPDAVHDARVAVRRLRATLRVFRDGTAPEPGTVGALTWWVRTLGAARDAEVRRTGLAELAAGLERPSPEVLAGLATLDGALVAADAAARAEVTAALASARCRDLTARLDALVTAPPLTDRSGEAAATTLRPAVVRELGRVGRHAGPVAAWRGPGTGDRPPPDVVHRLRKAVRRARYAAEVLATSGDRATDRWADDVVARHRELQDLLGTVHDADVLRATLAALREPRTAAAVDACERLGDDRAAQALAAAAAAVR
ncbi:CHAD domain-containing protein [Isoptericola sp. NPDC056134]|uniref:CHAD domain-containing protein n=1 Tax=Isoptericola sp. NPDC056134 TaxID=3345723 RepID=UPI0035E7E141